MFVEDEPMAAADSDEDVTMVVESDEELYVTCVHVYHLKFRVSAAIRFLPIYAYSP